MKQLTENGHGVGWLTLCGMALPACVRRSIGDGWGSVLLPPCCLRCCFHCGESCKANEAQRRRPNFAYLERETGGHSGEFTKKGSKGKEREPAWEGSHLLATLEGTFSLLW